MKEFWKTIDTVVMGRRTYEVAMKGGTVAYPGVKNYVFSRTLKKSSHKGIEIISKDAAEFVRKLKNQKGKDICVMGGGLLARSLFEANLIDVVTLVIPLVSVNVTVIIDGSPPIDPNSLSPGS